MKKIIKLIKKPSRIILYFMNKGWFNWLWDKKYIKMQYRLILNKKLDLDNPKTFNEKIQWLKLHDRKDIYTTMVDKYDAKQYIANIIGEEYIIPTIGVFDKFENIDFEKLPNQFVMKPTHTSGDIFICKDKKEINYNKLRKKAKKWLNKKYYYAHREWPYKNVKPRIIIEKYMEDSKDEEMIDYKFFCFNGIPKIMYLSAGSHNEHQKIAFFDMQYNKLEIKRSDYEDFKYIPKKPINFEKMKEICKILSKDIIHVRVDFYEINGKVYFGELTFYTGSGYIPFLEKKDDNILGDMIDLKKAKEN